MVHARPVAMSVKILGQMELTQPPIAIPWPEGSVLFLALSTVQAIFLHVGGLELLIDMARATSLDPNVGSPQWTEEWITQQAYAFFDPDIFPSFVIDYRKTDTSAFGHHSRTVDYNPVYGRLIFLNSSMIIAADSDPTNLIPIFKLIHTISHEIPHAFLSYLFAFHGNSQVIHFTPPNINYLDRYGDGTTRGEAGFWFDSAFWGGAVFYNQMTDHSNGDPCVYRQADNPQNVWVQLSPSTLNRIISNMKNATIPIITYTCERRIGGCLNTTSDGDLYQELDSKPPKFLNAPIGLHCASLHPFTIGEYRCRVTAN